MFYYSSPKNFTSVILTDPDKRVCDLEGHALVTVVHRLKKELQEF